MKELNRAAEWFTDSVIRRMTRIAIARDAINLAQGTRTSTRPGN